MSKNINIQKANNCGGFIVNNNYGYGTLIFSTYTDLLKYLNDEFNTVLYVRNSEEERIKTKEMIELELNNE